MSSHEPKTIALPYDVTAAPPQPPAEHEQQTIPDPSTPGPQPESAAVSTQITPESTAQAPQIPVIIPSTPVEKVQVPAATRIPLIGNPHERQTTSGHGQSHAPVHQNSNLLGHQQPHHDHTDDRSVIAAHHEQAARTISLIHESNQNMHGLLSGLALESQRAAAVHGDSLRALHTAIQELRRAHQEILSRLNQPQGQ